MARPRTRPRRPPPPPPPPPPKAEPGPQWWQRIVSRRKLPWWAWIALAIVREVPDWFHRADFWSATAARLEGKLGVLPSIVGSPYFSIGMIMIGLSYIIFVGEPKKDVQPRPWWPYIGWISFGILALAILVVAEAGVVVSIFSPERHLTKDQIQDIIDASKDVSSQFPSKLAVYAAETPEATGFAVELMDALSKGRVPIYSQSSAILMPLPMRALNASIKGVFILVFDPQHPPSQALLLQHILSKGGIAAPFGRGYDIPSDNQYGLIVGLP
jgi:hypothetical protein